MSLNDQAWRAYSIQTRNRRPVIALCVATIGLLAYICYQFVRPPIVQGTPPAHGGPGSLSYEPTPAEARFIATANALCARYNDQDNANVDGLDPAKVRANLKLGLPVLDKEIVLWRTFVHDFRAIAVPTTFTAELRALEADFDLFAKHLQRIRSASVHNDIVAFAQAAADLKNTTDQMNHVALAVGLTTCAG